MNARVLKNWVALLASQVYTALTALLLAAQLPRYLGESGYGLYSEIYAFVGLFEATGQLGLRVILTRQIARHKEQATHLLGQVLILKLPLAVVAFAIVMAATLVRPTTPFERFLITICLTESLVRGYSNTINGVLRAFELMEYNLVITLVDRTLAVGAVLAVIYLRLDLTVVFAAFFISGVGRLLTAALLCWHHAGHPEWGADLALWKRFVLETLPIGLSDATMHAYTGAGIVLLGTTGGATGLLSGPLRISHLTSALGTSVTDALFPVLSRASQWSSAQLGRVARNGLSVLLALAFPIAAFYAVFSEQFVPWFLGAEFAAAVSAFSVLTPALVFGFARIYFSSLLRASNHQQLDMLAILIALGVNVVCNIVLIPRLDFLGGAWALLVSEAVYLLIVLLLPARPLNVRAVGQALLPAAAGTVGCVAIWLFLAPVTVWVRLPLGATLYVAIWLLAARGDKGLWMFLLHLEADVRENIQTLARRVCQRN